MAASNRERRILADLQQFLASDLRKYERNQQPKRFQKSKNKNKWTNLANIVENKVVGDFNLFLAVSETLFGAFVFF